MRVLLRKNIIYFVVSLISILLVTNIALTYFNNSIIKRNQEIQVKVEKIKQYFDQIGKSVIHSMDIGLRGYAVIKNEQFAAPLHDGLSWKDSIFTSVEEPLRDLHYDFGLFNVFKDSVNSYARYCSNLKQLLAAGKNEEFIRMFSQDKGAHLWWQYLQVEDHINGFTESIDNLSKRNYETALYRNQILQVILFLICVPTLLITTSYTIKTFGLSELLRESQAEKNKLLSEQNAFLEKSVAERTHEIAAQNEEIVSQAEELSAQHDALTIQNKELFEAHKTIEMQHAEIRNMNEQLKTEVAGRTQELREANKELLEQNNQLEQFAFIAAHNLRAPLARILGLANLVQISSSKDDSEIALQKLVASTQDLDLVIRDLNSILNIKRHSANLAEVDLDFMLERVKRTLEKEIEETKAVITSDFREGDKVYAVIPYVESILYNLISNAIKYRDPERTPVIEIKTTHEDEFLCLAVTDNGLGIDLAKHQQNIFSLYKRFHLHMEGRGLGLYLVKTQVQSMGGKIDVKSGPNAGTTFYVYFRRYLIA